MAINYNEWSVEPSILYALIFSMHGFRSISPEGETNMYADDTDIDSASKPDCPEELENNLNVISVKSVNILILTVLA